MPILNKRYLCFDNEDVKLMQEMMKKFHELHQGTGMPDYSNIYSGYLPVFAIALLVSQEAISRLTNKLVWFTIVLAVLTAVLVWKAFTT